MKGIWKPRINSDLFVELSSGEYVNIYTGEVFTNKLSVQMLSDMFTRQQAGTATPKQLNILAKIGASSQDVAEWIANREREKTIDIVDKSEILKPYVDYVPEVRSDTPESERQWELAYNNFLTNLVNLTSEELMNVVKNALDRLNEPKWVIGRALNDMPQDILYYIGYGGYGDSGQSAVAFVSDLLDYLPLDSNERQNLEDELQSLSYGE